MMRVRVDVELLRTAASDARRVSEALGEAVREAEGAPESECGVLGRLAVAEVVLHVAQDAVSRLLRGSQEDPPATVADLPECWDRMMRAFWRLQRHQRPWPTADGEFVEALGHVKEIIDGIRGRRPGRSAPGPAPDAAEQG
jgi:hypothetical protein